MRRLRIGDGIVKMRPPAEPCTNAQAREWRIPTSITTLCVLLFTASLKEGYAMPQHLGEFEQLILFALLRLGDNAYGVTVRQEIDARTGRDVSQGAVYTALNRLADRGFVTSRIGETVPDRGGRRRKYYALQPAGARALRRSFTHVQDMATGLLPQLTELAEGSR